MIKVKISYDVAAEKITKIQALLDSAERDFCGATFELIRDDFTYIEGDETIEKINLLAQINNIIFNVNMENDPFATS